MFNRISEIPGLNETEVTHLVTTSELLPKILSLIESLPTIKTIIYMECPYKKEPKPTVRKEGLRLIPFSQLEALGRTADPSLVGKRCVVLRFSPDLTARPKHMFLI